MLILCFGVLELRAYDTVHNTTPKPLPCAAFISPIPTSKIIEHAVMDERRKRTEEKRVAWQELDREFPGKEEITPMSGTCARDFIWLPHEIVERIIKEAFPGEEE